MTQRPTSQPSHVGGASDGDPRISFDAFARAHYERLCNFAYRYVESRDVVEDIVQDVLTELWRRREQFDVRDPLPYLYQAVRNRALTYVRHRRVRERWQARVLAEGEPHTADTAPDVELTDLARAIASAVDALPERCRLIFTMSREQDLTYADIARILGLSVKTVEAQMGRALKALRTRLAPFL